MVLQKVGEFQTTVNVNGEEKVSTLQSSDKTYNLSESFNTTINVNGSQKLNTTQSSDSSYDISASIDKSETKIYSYSIGVNNQEFGSDSLTVEAPPNVVNGEASYDIYADYQDADADVLRNGSLIEQTTGGRSTGTFSVTPNDTVTIEVYADYRESTAEINFECFINPSIIVDGVSQS